MRETADSDLAEGFRARARAASRTFREKCVSFPPHSHRPLTLFQGMPKTLLIASASFEWSMLSPFAHSTAD
jgi:hypothetical protein